MSKYASLGKLLTSILYHYRSVEEWLLNSKAVNQLNHNSKYRVNRSIEKMKSAIGDIIDIIPDKELAKKVVEHINRKDVVYYMALTEMLFDLNKESLEDITDLVEDYLTKKHANTNGTERQDDPGRDAGREHRDNGLPEGTPEPSVGGPDTSPEVQDIRPGHPGPEEAEPND